MEKKTVPKTKVTREERISVNVTEMERKTIEAFAQKLGLTAAAFLRSVGLRDATKTVPVAA